MENVEEIEVDKEDKNDEDVLELDYGNDELEVAPSTPKSTTPEEPKLANSRLLWISGIDETMKANDFKVAFEPHGKVESGKLVKISSKSGAIECKGIVTMKTIEGADRVIAEMNGKKVAGFTVTIEKRLNDPTDRGGSKVTKEVKPKQPITDPVLEAIEPKAINERKYEQPVKEPEPQPKNKVTLEGPSSAELARAEANLREARDAMRRARDKANQSRAELKKVRQELQQEKDQSAKAKERVRETRKKRAALNKEHEEIKKDRKEIKEQIINTQQDCDIIKSKISRARMDLQEYKEKLRRLERNNDREREEREKLQAERRRVEEDRRKYEEERRRLEHEKNKMMKSRARSRSPPTYRSSQRDGGARDSRDSRDHRGASDNRRYNERPSNHSQRGSGGGGGGGSRENYERTNERSEYRPRNSQRNNDNGASGRYQSSESRYNSGNRSSPNRYSGSRNSGGGGGGDRKSTWGQPSPEKSASRGGWG